VAYVEALEQIFDTTVVAIPYSVNRLAAQRLAAGGHEVTVPTSLAEIAPLVVGVARRAAKSGQPIVVQEIGGYLANHAGELAEIPGFRGIVEDTNNGHWRYQSVADTLRCPVISIAHSPIKGLEDAQIGEAVAFSVERVLRHRLSVMLRGARVLVLGYGTIGASCCAAFRQRGAQTQAYDVDPLKLMRAQAAGISVAPLQEAARRADVVVGATGRCSIDAAVAACLSNGAVLASASSRQVEIDMAALRQAYRMKRVAAEISRYSTKGRHFFVLNDGYPINFRDHSVVGPYLDAVYAELFVCVREVVEGRARSGLHVSWSRLHQEVCSRWCAAHLPEFGTPGLRLNHRTTGHPIGLSNGQGFKPAELELPMNGRSPAAVG
jgi:adenosylhomocysteinase